MWRLLQAFPRCNCPLTKGRWWSQSAALQSKYFVDRENAYAHGILTSAGISTPASVDIVSSSVSTRMDLESLLSQDFRRRSASEIVRTFQVIAPLCCRESVRLSDPVFDRLVDGLMDRAEHLSDVELLQLLDVLAVLPPFENLDDSNYHDVWSCLDDIACWRIGRWRPAMLLAVGDRWYRLHLAATGDFVCRALDKLTLRAAPRLRPTQLVHALFLFNVARRRRVPFALEHALERCVDELTVDELAVAALGFFKTQSKVKVAHILSVMLRKAKAAAVAGGVHEMSLCAILKLVRLSANPLLADQVHDFLVHVTPTLARASTLCVLHAALLGTTIQLAYTPVLQLAAERIVAGMSDVAGVRLKDIERLLLALTMFDHDPQTTPCVFAAAMRELAAERRNVERVRHPRCFVAALGHLAMRDTYDRPLLAHVLAPDFAAQVYGASARVYPRELFLLDTSIDVEVAGYEGPRLDTTKRRKVVRWLTEYTPSHTQTHRISAADRLILDVRDALVDLVAGEANLLVDHLLPHYARADFVVCRDVASGVFVPPFGLDAYELGDIYVAPTSATHRFYAIVVVGWNNAIRNTSRPVGMIAMKCRQLERIGYRPVTIIWHEFAPLGHEDRKGHILDKLAA